MRSRIFGFVLAASGVVYACADDRPPTSDLGGETGQTSAAVDAGSKGGVTFGLCALVTADASAPVQAVYLPGAVPAAAGGELTKATYLLTGIQIYDTAPAVDAGAEIKQGFVSFDLVVSSSGAQHMEIVGEGSSKGVAYETTRLGGYWTQTAATSLDVNDACSNLVGATVAYTSSPSSFTVHLGNRLETYTLKQ